MKLLSCAGTRANLRDIIGDYDRLGDGVWDIFNASKDKVAWYYTSMLDAFGNGDKGKRDMPAFQEFEKCVGEMFGDGGEIGSTAAGLFFSMVPAMSISNTNPATSTFVCLFIM